MRRSRPLQLAALTATFALVGCAGTSRPASPEGALGVGEAAAPRRAALDVEHCRVELSLRPPTGAPVRGSARFDARALDDVGGFDLTAPGLEVLALAEYAVDGTARPLEFVRTSDRITITRPLRAGERLSLEVDYAVADAGRTALPSTAQRWPATDVDEAAVGWLPRLGGDGDRATLDLALDLPADWRGHAAGELVLAEAHDGRRRERWRETVPRVLADLAPRAASGGPESVPASWGSRGTTAEHSLAVEYIAARLGRSLPSASPRLMERASPGGASLESVALRTAIAAAREWFGGLIAAAGDDDAWLTDALARYVGALCEEEARGVAPGVAARAAAAPALGSAGGARGVGRLHLLRSVLGDEAFDATLRRIVGRSAHAELGVEDLREAAEFIARRDLGVLFDSWFATPVVPVVEVAWRYDPARARVLVRVEQVHDIDDGAPAAFPFTAEIQFAVTVDGAADVRRTTVDLGGRRELLEVSSDAEPRWLTLDGAGWIPIDVRYDRGAEEARLVASEHPEALARELAREEMAAGARPRPAPFASVGEAVDEQ